MKNVILIDDQRLTEEWIVSGRHTIRGANQLILYVYLELGAIATAEMQIELGPQGRLCKESLDRVEMESVTQKTVTRKFYDSDPYRIAIPVYDEEMRVGVRGIGEDLTGSTIRVVASWGRVN